MTFGKEVWKVLENIAHCARMTIEYLDCYLDRARVHNEVQLPLSKSENNNPTTTKCRYRYVLAKAYLYR
jgi:hypothetical protein